ncbi:MAG: VOC family protein [Hyphomicrobiales bacterium]
MSVSLDHINIRTNDLEGVKDKLVDVLGLEIGARPPFPFPGYWLYGAGKPIIHLTTCDDSPGNETGALDHVAFRGSDYDGLVARLTESGTTFDAKTVPGTGARQIFFEINHNIMIEVGFDPA